MIIVSADTIRCLSYRCLRNKRNRFQLGLVWVFRCSSTTAAPFVHDTTNRKINDNRVGGEEEEERKNERKKAAFCVLSFGVGCRAGRQGICLPWWLTPLKPFRGRHRRRGLRLQGQQHSRIGCKCWWMFVDEIFFFFVPFLGVPWQPAAAIPNVYFWLLFIIPNLQSSARWRKFHRQHYRCPAIFFFP